MAKSPAWQRAEGKNPKGGLNAKGRASAKAQGMNLKPPVKKAEAAKSPKSAGRRKSQLQMKKKAAFWDTKNPKTKSKKLTPAQKAAAKARAKAAGRPYPNLIDNAAASRKKKK